MKKTTKDMDKVNEFKLVLLGMSGVGKTSLIDRFVNEKFDTHMKSTIGNAYVVKTVRVRNISIKLKIWDTAGQERFLALTSMYMRNSQAAVAVFDIGNETSYFLAQSWIRTLKAQDPPAKVIALAANKSEPVNKFAVDIPCVQQYADENDIIFLETSAKTALNVKEMFFTIAERLSIRYECNELSEDQKTDDAIKLNSETRGGGAKKKCCL